MMSRSVSGNWRFYLRSQLKFTRRATSRGKRARKSIASAIQRVDIGVDCDIDVCRLIQRDRDSIDGNRR